MSNKITLTDLVNLQNETTAVNAINTNNTQLEDAIDNSLWRTGSYPNQMEVNLDMNSNRILNLPAAIFDHEPVRLEELNRAMFDATTVVLSYGLSNALNFDTRAAGQATQIPLVVNYITISKYAVGFPRCDAPYVRGGTVIPFTDALGNQWGLDLSGGISHIYWFGVKADGVTDDTVNMQTAATQSAGCTLYVKGLVGLSFRISLPSNSSIQGLGASSNGFLSLGSNSFNLGMLYCNNVSNIRIQNLYFQGNLIDSGGGSVGAIKFELDIISPIGDMENLSVIGCTFRNFKQSEWIGFIHASNSLNRMIGINVSDNYVYATQQCVNQNGGNFFCYIYPNNDPSTAAQFAGDTMNVVFRGNKIIGLGLGGALGCVGSVHDVVVSGNVTMNMGNYSVAADRTYTYMFYASTVNPFNISIVGNSGYGHKNNAVYYQETANSVITGNSFEFVYPGGIEPTLPWGAAISLNGARDTSVTGNSLYNALGGIAFANITTPTVPFATDGVVISGNTITNNTTTSLTQAPYGILLTGGPTNTDALTVISGNAIKVTTPNGSGISMFGNVGRLKIANNVIESSGSGVNTTGTTNPKAIDLTGNLVFGALEFYGIDISLNTGVLFMNDNVVDFSQVVSGSTGGIRLSGEVHIDGLKLYKKMSSGSTVVTGGATGTIRNVSFPKQGNAVPFIDFGGLGSTVPTHTGQLNDFVQNLNGPTEIGTAGGRYVLTGWINGDQATLWLPQRILTGN